MKDGGWKKPAEEELKKKLTPLQYQVTQQERDGARVPQRVLGQPRARHLRGRRLGRAAVLLARQVRLGHGLAELHAAPREGERGGADATPRSAWSAPRCARSTPTRTSATSSTTARSPTGLALLHQLGRRCASSRVDEARAGRLRRVPALFDARPTGVGRPDARTGAAGAGRRRMTAVMPLPGRRRLECFDASRPSRPALPRRPRRGARLRPARRRPRRPRS